MWLALTALVAGSLHALEADHLAAVMTLVAKERRLAPSVWLGLVWGLGHTASVAAVGMPLLLLRGQLPPGVALALEWLVGLLMVALGVHVLWDAQRTRPSRAPHPATREAPTTSSHRPKPWHALLSFATGIVHGLAGSGGAVALAVALAPSTLHGVAFLAAFGVGNALGMAVLTLFLAMPGRWASRLHGRAEWVLQTAVGVASIAIGIHRWQTLF